MKGIVFKLLEDAVTAEHGEATWDRLLAATHLEGAYTTLGSYPDEELFKIVLAASTVLGVPSNDLLRWFGERAIPRLAQVYPEFFAAHRTTRPFVLSLNDVIHPEVRKLYPGADVPWFDFETPTPNQLIIGYRSNRRLCTFAEGLIQGAATHYRESVAIEQQRCMLRGDDKCLIACSFQPRAT
jgi:hypothetical protein